MLSHFLILLTVITTTIANPFLEPKSNNVFQSLTKRIVSSNQTCGGTNRSTCPSGECCSQHGYCGSSEDYCVTGCQPGFGKCNSPPSTTLLDCLGISHVPAVYAPSSSFAQLAEPFNLRLQYIPEVIILPTSVQDVANAVICAVQNNVKVQAKSGGHSYASFSSGGKDGSMVIDLENFQDVNVDANGIAKIGGGVRLGNMALAIYNQSRRALPHGTCSGIGIGGHASHGGYGYAARLWGITLDTIVALDVVLANGSFIHATKTAYPDIYFALRGAADSFGIITTFYLQTQPAPASVVNWAYTLPGMYESAAAPTAAFLHIQDFARNASVVDGKLGFGVHVDGQSFGVSGTYLGDLATFTNSIAPALLNGLPTPASTSVRVVDWITSLTLLAAPNPLQQPTLGYNLHDDFYAKSLVVPTPSPLTSAALNSYFTYIIKNGVNPPSPWFSIINLYGGPGSQINVPSPSSSAYSDRTALWVLQHYGDTTDTTDPFPPAEFTFINGLNTAIESAMPNTTFGGYLNYVDPSLTPAQAHALYYGAETYAKLLAIKQVVDPGHVFWNPQSIGN